MFEPRVLLKRKFRLADVAIAVEDREWTPNPEYDRLASEAWAERLHYEAKRDGDIWDGTNYRVANVRDIETSSGPITLRLGRVRYRYIATYWALHERFHTQGLEPMHHLSTAAIIRTQDGWYVFGSRSVDGSIDLIGGGAQVDELPITAGADLEANLVKETREEIGLSKDRIVRQIAIGILRSQTSNVLTISQIEIALTRTELDRVFAHREDDEMARLEYVPAEEIGPYLQGLGGYRPLIRELMAGLEWSAPQ